MKIFPVVLVIHSTMSSLLTPWLWVVWRSWYERHTVWGAFPCPHLSLLPPLITTHNHLFLSPSALNLQPYQKLSALNHHSGSPPSSKSKEPSVLAFSATATPGSSQTLHFSFPFSSIFLYWVFNLISVGLWITGILGKIRGSEQNKTLFDLLLSNSIGKTEGSVEKKLRETGEWIIDRAEGTSRSAGILLVSFHFLFSLVFSTWRKSNFSYLFWHFKTPLMITQVLLFTIIMQQSKFWWLRFYGFYQHGLCCS